MGAGGHRLIGTGSVPLLTDGHPNPRPPNNECVLSQETPYPTGRGAILTTPQIPRPILQPNGGQVSSCRSPSADHYSLLR